MSKIRLHGSSSGYTEIAPVAASGNNTLTLPNDGTIISKDSNGAVGVTSITVGTGVTIGDGRVTCTTVHGAASGLTGALPALNAASLTQIPAANIVGVCTAGFERSGGFGGGISDFDTWYLTSSVSGNTNPISSNWSRWTNDGGTGTVTFDAPSSGVFTFPSTGYWLLEFNVFFNSDGNNSERGCNNYIYITENNSAYTSIEASTNLVKADDNTNISKGHTKNSYIFDVTDTSTHKAKFSVGYNQRNNTAYGTGSYLYTHVKFFKLQDT